MKVTNSPQHYINQSYATNNATNGNAASNQEKRAEDTVASDSINLSSTTRDLQKIAVASETQPAERAQKVEELKRQVQANQYTVNAEQVAEKMIGSIMDELG